MSNNTKHHLTSKLASELVETLSTSELRLFCWEPTLRVSLEEYTRDELRMAAWDKAYTQYERLTQEELERLSNSNSEFNLGGERNNA